MWDSVQFDTHDLGQRNSRNLTIPGIFALPLAVSKNVDVAIQQAWRVHTQRNRSSLQRGAPCRPDNRLREQSEATRPQVGPGGRQSADKVTILSRSL